MKLLFAVLGLLLVVAINLDLYAEYGALNPFATFAFGLALSGLLVSANSAFRK